jgi:hypothetical protein
MFVEYGEVPVHERRFASGLCEFAARFVSAARSAAGAGQHHAHTQHCHRSDDDAEQEERARGSGDVVAEYGEILGQWVSGTGVAQNSDDPHDHSHEENS